MGRFSNVGKLRIFWLFPKKKKLFLPQLLLTGVHLPHRFSFEMLTHLVVSFCIWFLGFLTFALDHLNFGFGRPISALGVWILDFAFFCLMTDTFSVSVFRASLRARINICLVCMASSYRFNFLT